MVSYSITSLCSHLMKVEGGSFPGGLRTCGSYTIWCTDRHRRKTLQTKEGSLGTRQLHNPAPEWLLKCSSVCYVSYFILVIKIIPITPKEATKKKKKTQCQFRRAGFWEFFVFSIRINDTRPYVKKWHPTAPPGGHEPSVICHKLT